MSPAPPRPVAMTVAGFDPSSGAGVTADLLTFEANGCFGTSAVTALTVQSTTGVRRVQAVEPQLLADTLLCLEEDLPPDGIKIGMLANSGNVAAVSEFLLHLRQRRRVRVVLDPVLVSSSGASLLSSAGRTSLVRDLLPLVDVITPNVAELEVLTGMPCSTPAQLHAAMQQVTTLHPSLSVIATGGHRVEPEDLLLDENVLTVLPGQHIETRASHGTGCAYSSALLAWLLRGLTLPQAATAAKRYVEGGMHHAEVRGSGHGPLRLLWTPQQHRPAEE